MNCNIEECDRQTTSKSAHGMCSMHYQRKQRGAPLTPPQRSEHPQCTIDGCSNKPRSRYAEYCGKHYHRIYRHGDADANYKRTESQYKQVRAYRVVGAKGHPLAWKTGLAYEHRVVLYDQIGDGPHECTWCGKTLSWFADTHSELLVPDHLNGDEADNRVDNLVPSCQRCNTARAVQLRSVSLRAQGAWKNNDTVARVKKSPRIPVIDARMVDRLAG